MVNVVMLIKGRLRLTRQALESLYSHTPAEQFNCTVVNDSEEDFRVTRLLQEYTHHRNFSLLQVANSGHVLAQLKNLGVGWSSQRFGRGDWLHLGDGDVCFMPEWLEKMMTMAEATEGSDFRLWGGQVHPFHQPIASVPGMTEHDILDGPSWFMRWSTWRNFSRRNAPGPCQSEEYPWCARLVADGGRIGVITPHVVIHTGLTNTDGEDAPGRRDREAVIPDGVIAE